MENRNAWAWFAVFIFVLVCNWSEKCLLVLWKKLNLDVSGKYSSIKGRKAKNLKTNIKQINIYIFFQSNPPKKNKKKKKKKSVICMKLTLTPCAVATCLFSTSSDLFPTRIFCTLSGAYCGGIAMGYTFTREEMAKVRKGHRQLSRELQN